ncbi:uncharacterized protein [Molothrus aeneus]|uniref:uncharacterized protein isoform X1 n=1 Tax=Molothrus aeneus TaxID=84833 RepID=UPI0034594DC2
MLKAVLAGAAWSLPCPSPETQREPCAQGPLAPCQERGSSPGSRLEEQTSQQSQIAVEARAVFGAGSAESCVCLCCPSLSTGTGNSLGKGIGAVADAQGEEHKPTAIQPDSPLHPELSTHPHREAQQLKGKKNPQKEKQPAGKGEEDPCGMRVQRASRGAASGWRKAKGPTRWHQGTCEEQNGHLEATWRKGMHSFVFSTPPVAPTWESFPSLLHFQLDPWKTPNSIPLIFRCQRHEVLLPFRSSWPPPALRSQPAGTQPGNTKEHGWQPAGDTEAPGPEKQPWPQQPASFGAGSTHLQATPPGTLQKSFGHGASPGTHTLLVEEKTAQPSSHKKYRQYQNANTQA